MNTVWDVHCFLQHKDSGELHFTDTLALQRKQMSPLTKWREDGNSELQFGCFGANSNPSTGKYWEWGIK